MRKHRRKTSKIVIIVLLAVLISGTAFYISLAASFYTDLKNDFASQKEWLATLTDTPRPPVEEQGFASFDLSDNDYKLNEVQFIATHNSFKSLPNPYITNVLRLFNPGGVKKGEYGLPKLYDQLDSGIRGVELDVAMYGSQPVTVHNVNNDWRTSTTDFRLALEEIKIWSDNNPGHFPVNIMVQVRNQFSVFSPKFRPFDSASVSGLNAMLAEVFEDKLLHPASFKGDAATMREAVARTAWPRVSDCMGKIYVMLLFNEESNEEFYKNLDPSFSAQNAFVITDVDKQAPRDYTAIILADHPEEKHRPYIQAGYIVRTRIDLQYEHPEARRRDAIALGSNILATDYPLNNSYGDGYVCWAGEEGITIIARG